MSIPKEPESFLVDVSVTQTRQYKVDARTAEEASIVAEGLVSDPDALFEVQDQDFEVVSAFPEE